MVHEKRLIDLGSNVLRVTKTGCLTKLPGTRPDDFSSLNYKDLGEFNIRLDFLIAEESGDNYSVPAKSGSVSLNAEQRKQLFELLQPTAGTAVGEQHGFSQSQLANIGAALRLACQNSDIEDSRLLYYGDRLIGALKARGFKIEVSNHD